MRKFTKAEIERIAAVAAHLYWGRGGHWRDEELYYRNLWARTVKAVLREASRIEASKRKVKR